MSDLIKSASVVIAPIDSRCRYWAKIARADARLPKPADVTGAADLSGQYLRKGDEELFPGDVLIEGEEVSHRKARGWTYRIVWCDAEGVARYVRNPGHEIKAELKAAGLDLSLLAGAGGVAACVRLAHAIRVGLFTGGDFL